MRSPIKILAIFLYCLFGPSLFAYDICNPRLSFNTIAENICFQIEQRILETNENFNLRGVTLFKDQKSFETSDHIILIPGGPGGDSQGLALSLNQKSLLDAMWNHLNLNVTLYDPRGTGNSELSESAEMYPYEVFSTDEQVRDLRTIIDRVSPDKAVYLFAHSAGGNTAAKFASLYPQRVKGLILYSASIDTREIGESNLRIFAKEFTFWNQYLEGSCAQEKITELEGFRLSIEKTLSNVLKLQRIGNVRPSELQSRFYYKEFRVELIKAVENDPDCNGPVGDVMKKWNDRILRLPVAVLAKLEQAENLRFDPKNHTPPLVKRGTWIKTAVICSEGILTHEHQSALWLDGLDFEDDTCFNTNPLYDTPPSRKWLKDIKAPTLLFGGTEDPFQIPSAVKRNARSIPNSTILMVEGAGHEIHLTHPMAVFNALENFLIE